MLYCDTDSVVFTAQPGEWLNQDTDKHMVTVSETIKRDKKHFHLKNDTVTKKVEVVYNKCRVLSDYTTLPYGY